MRRVWGVFFLTAALYADQAMPNLSDQIKIDKLVETVKHAPRPPAPAFKNVFFVAPSQGARASKPSKPVLASVIGNRALISGGWRQVGDRFGGYLIEEVHSDYVILNRGGETMKITLERRNTSGQVLKVSGQ